MKMAQDIIVRPIITEKSMHGLASKCYTFQVAKNSNKIEIKKAVEELFKVSVDRVTTTNVRGQVRRVGAHTGRRPDWKKAYVKLAPSSKTIEFFDGLM